MDMMLADFGFTAFIILTAISIALSLISSLLLKAKKPKLPTPDETSPLTNRGATIPLVLGRRRISHIFAWVGDRQIDEHSSGKPDEYYEAAWHLLCLGPATRIPRFFRDGKIMRPKALNDRLSSTAHQPAKTTGVTTLSTTVSGLIHQYTRASGSFLADGFKAKDRVTGRGFTNAANNVTSSVLAVTATTLRVSASLVAETGTGDESLSAPNFLRLRNEGQNERIALRVFWGELSQPLNEYLGEEKLKIVKGTVNGVPDVTISATPFDPPQFKRVQAQSRWPSVCYVEWNRFKLGISPQWPTLNYEVFVPVTESTALVQSNAYIPETFDILAASAPATAGTFTISIAGETTAAIAYNASAATVQAAIDALPSVNFAKCKTVNGGLTTGGGGVNVAWGGNNGHDYIEVTINANGLTGNKHTLKQDYANEGVNLVHAMYQLITAKPPRGCSFDPALIDLPSFEAAGVTVQDEHLAFNIFAPDSITAAEICLQILQDAGLLLIFKDGKLSLVKSRRAAAGASKIFNDDQLLGAEPSIEIFNTPNRIDRNVYTFKDRKNLYKDMDVSVADDGLGSLRGGANIRRTEIANVNDETTALTIVDRKIQEDMVAPGVVVFRAAREGRSANPGDTIKLPEIGLVRVISIKRLVNDPLAEIEAIQDPFQTDAVQLFPTINPDAIAEAVAPDDRINFIELPFKMNPGTLPALGVFRDRAHEQIEGAVVHIAASAEASTITANASPATAGTFTLTVAGQTTGTIAYNATASTIQTALEALSTVDVGDVSVVNTVGSSLGEASAKMTISWLGQYLGQVPEVSINTTGLTGNAHVLATVNANYYATVFQNEPSIGVTLIDALTSDGDWIEPTSIRFEHNGDISRLLDLTGDDESWGRGRQMLIVGDEILFFRSAAIDNNNTYQITDLIRARFDTAQAAHAAGAKGFIVNAQKITVVLDPLLSASETVYVKTLPFTQREIDDLADQKAVSRTLTQRSATPLMPDNLRGNDSANGKNVNLYTATGDVTFAWTYRVKNGNGAAAGELLAGNPIVSTISQSDGDFILELFTSAGALVRTDTLGPTVTSVLLTNATLKAALGNPLPATFKAKLHVREGSLRSPKTEITLTRE